MPGYICGQNMVQIPQMSGKQIESSSIHSLFIAMWRHGSCVELLVVVLNRPTKFKLYKTTATYVPDTT